MSKHTQYRYYDHKGDDLLGSPGAAYRASLSADGTEATYEAFWPHHREWDVLDVEALGYVATLDDLDGFAIAQNWPYHEIAPAVLSVWITDLDGNRDVNGADEVHTVALRLPARRDGTYVTYSHANGWDEVEADDLPALFAQIAATFHEGAGKDYYLCCDEDGIDSVLMHGDPN
jgi:hypothetical protein